MTRREQARLVTRANILRAAKRCFTDHGFTGVDMRTLAAAANVSTGAIFSNFKGKRELFEAVFPDDYRVRLVAEGVCIAFGRRWSSGPRTQWFAAAERALKLQVAA